MLDIDYFKSINDAFGHARGDQTLVDLVRRIYKHIRESDEIYRYGGDEFVVLLPQTDREAAITTAGRLLDAIQDAPFGEAPQINISVSIGVSTFPVDAVTVEDLFESADRRHYLGKAHGRRQVVSQDDIPAREVGLYETERLIERDIQIQVVRGLFDELSAGHRALLQVAGTSGSGRSRFLSEIHKLARLRGCEVLSVNGGMGLKSRRFGALLEAQQVWDNWPAALCDSDALSLAISERLVQKGLSGLVIFVDECSNVDEATRTAALALLNKGILDNVILVWVCGEDVSFPVHVNSKVLRQSVRLEPLSLFGAQIWLRQALGWEAPDEFIAWFYDQAGGLPARLKRAISWLVSQRGIRPGPQGWILTEQYTSLPLQEALGRLELPPNNLPWPLTPFIGRADEILRIRQLLSNSGMVTLLAPNGMGKTRLAIQVGAEVLANFPDGVFFVSFTTVDSALLLHNRIAGALRYRFRSLEDTTRQLLEYLGSRRMLLILDGLEGDLVDTPLLGQIMETAPQVRLLVTSTARLNLPGESLVELSGLPLAHPDPRSSEAAQLFLESARSVLPGYTPSETDWPDILRICRAVEGNPLGLELAAASVSMLPWGQIADSIERNLGSDQLHPGRLDVVFDSLWDTLSEAERSALSALSIFQGGFTAEAARQVTGASPFFLDGLVTHLLAARTTNRRYTLPGLLVGYAFARLKSEHGPLERLRNAHAAYYASLLSASHAARQGSPSLDELGPEVDNLRAAWDWSVQAGHVEQVAQALPGFYNFLVQRGWFQEAIRVLELARADLSGLPGSDLLHVRLLINLAELDYHTGGYEGGCTRLYAALEALEHLDEPFDKASALRMLGSLYSSRGKFEESFQAYNRGLELARLENDLVLQYRFLSSIGVLHYYRQDYPMAQEWLEQALEIARRSEDPEEQAGCLNNMGNVCYQRGELERARTLLEESLALCTYTPSQTLRGAVLDSIGKICTAGGNFSAAAAYFRQGLVLVRGLDALPLTLELLIGIAELWHRQGKSELARRLAGMVSAHPAAVHEVHLRAEHLCTLIPAVEPSALPDPWTAESIPLVVIEVLPMLAEE